MLLTLYVGDQLGVDPARATNMARVSTASTFNRRARWLSRQPDGL